mmetsp:Transcript_7670/g.17058  ORF Transcript_7670/g.17058 Transcript_7670/m.17058 type:complete len:80 (-) Transcript_7670:2291-2530(-)
MSCLASRTSRIHCMVQSKRRFRRHPIMSRDLFRDRCAHQRASIQTSDIFLLLETRMRHSFVYASARGFPLHTMLHESTS